ncbi:MULTISPECIES: HEPN domain-containing protein [Microbacterium]|uniref:ApeA N-terminal domain 1-containing protein n=1 Tax=Microbacterium TaxID=33882 RepID=UPI0027D7C8E2|nr:MULTISPECIES: HEPN domain-containing protein [Microbacterium]
MGEKTWRGYWWLPERPEEKAPGRLVIQDDGACQLELIGGLDLPGDMRSLDASDRVPVILGAAEGQEVTLLDCFTTNRDGWGRRPDGLHDIHVHEALVGAHVADGEAAFSAALLSIENLSSFLQMDQFISRSGGSTIESAASRRSPDITCQVDDWLITARALVQPFHVSLEHSRVAVSGEVEAYLVLRPPSATWIDDFNSMVLELTDLVTLATGQASGRISMTLIHKDPFTRTDVDGTALEWERRVDVFSKRTHTADPEAASPRSRQFLFTRGDMPFDVLVPRWVHIRRRAPDACNVFFGLRYARPTYTEVRLLLLSITAETLHGSLYGDETELHDDVFQSLRTRILDAIEDASERVWVKSRLRNTPSFRERMVSLATKPDESALALVIDDVPKWARTLRTARNNLAHTGNESASDAMFSLEWVTNSLITLVLLAELGLSSDVQTRAAKDILGLPPGLH